MVVWTVNAILHITEFIDETREGTEETAKTCRLYRHFRNNARDRQEN